MDIGYFIKLALCRGGEAIIKVTDICILKSDGALSMVFLIDTNHSIKVQHSIDEIEKMLNLTEYRVICSLRTNGVI